MSAEHTTGSCRYDYEPGYCGELIASNGKLICSFVEEPSPADARRLVACWNACQGISTEGIEAITALGGMTHKMPVAAGLVRQSDDLLSALREIAETSTDPGAVACATAAIYKLGASS